MDRLIEFVTNHWLLVLGFVVVMILLLQDLLESALRKHKATTPLEAVVLMNNQNAAVLDIREPPEYAKGHIENAFHIPLGNLDERIGELEPFKSSPLIIVCQSGTRAPQACKKLKKHGFEQVFELKGGIMAWQEASLPVTKG